MVRDAEFEEIRIDNWYNWSWNEYNPVSTGYQKCKPDHSFGPGVVEISTIHYVLSGSGTFIANGKEYHITKDQMFCFGPLEPVFYKADKHDPWTYVWITFIATEFIPYRFEQYVMDVPFLRPIFESIRDYPDHKNTGRDFTIHCLNEIAHQLMKRTANSSYLVERAVELIRRKYSSELLTVASLSNMLGVSRYTLSEAFMKDKHISPSEYLIRYRMEKASEYMTHQKFTPLIVANSVGYTNYRHFSKMFKKYCGLSPREYHQKVNNK